MTIKSNKDELLAKYRQKLADNLEIACREVESQALINIKGTFKVGKGNLKNRMYHRVDGLRGIVGNDAIYARQKEFGGIIKPRNKQALAIPVHPQAYDKRPEEFGDELFMLKRPGRVPLLVRKAGRGMNHGRLDIMYVLAKQVNQPPHPFLRPALEATREQVIKILAKGL